MKGETRGKQSIGFTSGKASIDRQLSRDLVVAVDTRADAAKPKLQSLGPGDRSERMLGGRLQQLPFNSEARSALLRCNIRRARAPRRSNHIGAVRLSGIEARLGFQ